MLSKLFPLVTRRLPRQLCRFSSSNRPNLPEQTATPYEGFAAGSASLEKLLAAYFSDKHMSMYDVNLDEVTLFMDSHILGQTQDILEMDPDLFDRYVSLLVRQVCMWFELNHPERANINQMQILMRFGNEFSVNEQPYLTYIRKYTERLMKAQAVSDRQLLFIAHQLG